MHDNESRQANVPAKDPLQTRKKADGRQTMQRCLENASFGLSVVRLPSALSVVRLPSEDVRKSLGDGRQTARRTLSLGDMSSPITPTVLQTYGARFNCRCGWALFGKRDAKGEGHERGVI